MKSRDAALLMKHIAETPAARKALAAALASDDPAEVDRVMESLGGVRRRRATSDSDHASSPSPQAYFT